MADKKKLSGANLISFLKDRPLYYFIFLLHFPVSIFIVYSGYYDEYGLVPAAIVILTFGGLLYAILCRIVPDQQVAALAGLIVLLILIPKSTMTAPAYPYLAAAGALLIARALWQQHRRRQRITRASLRLPALFTPVANLIAVVMLVAICAFEGVSTYRVARDAGQIAANLPVRAKDIRIATAPAALPHIVHIVLDGYSRADVLQSVYGFDNTPFLNALTARGFRVADRATTPYNQTLFVMSSIFSMARVTDALGTPLDEQDLLILRRTLARVQQEGTVVQLLRSLGYEMQSAPSAYFPLQWSSITPKGTDALNQFRLPGTYVFLHDLLRNAPTFAPLANALLHDAFSIDAVDFQILRDVPHRRFTSSDGRPLFVYQHLLAPHPPFDITADGARRPLNGMPSAIEDGSHLLHGDAALRRQYREGYVEKLRYINGAILRQIDGLKETLTGPLIVVLHGDHGGGLYHELESKRDTCLHERFSPLLAIYATDPEILDAITPDFDIVNIYRVILRNLLDTELPDLPARSTFVSASLNTAVDMQPGELAASCPGAAGPVVAGDPAPAGPRKDAPLSR